MSNEQSFSIEDHGVDADRREFLRKAGRFAAVTPPAITMLLVTSMNSNAVAGSGGNNGWGNGGNDGTNPGSFRGNAPQSGSKGANVLR